MSKEITINIDKLIDKMVVVVNDGNASRDQLEEKITEILTRAVNSAELSVQGQSSENHG